LPADHHGRSKPVVKLPFVFNELNWIVLAELVIFTGHENRSSQMLRAIRRQFNSCRRSLLMHVPKIGYADLTSLWWRQRSWMEPYKEHLQPDGRAGTRILARRFMLIELAKSVANLRGSTAECGVARGTGSALICETLKDTYKPDEFHFAFDSFAGVSEPTSADVTAAGTCNWYKGKLSHDFESVQNRLGKFPFCRVVRGWIPQCFQVLHDSQPFRFVHIDVDLYEPTLASLNALYPRLVPGGVIVFDDHGFRNCPGARKAAEEFFAEKNDSIVELTTSQAFVIKRSA
jgi:hypothetical protein